MPAPFSPAHIPFISGVRQDVGKIAQENPSQLRQAQNVVFTRRGHITGRPGFQSRDAQVQIAPGIPLGPSLTAQVAGSTPSGVVATGFQTNTASGVDTPLACWQGQSYYNRAGIWEYAGVHWSLRQTKSTVLTLNDPVFGATSNEVPVGQDIVGTLTTAGNASGVPFLTGTGEIKYISTTIDGAVPPGAGLAVANMSASAGNALFWSVVGNIVGVFPIVLPTTTPVMTLAASTGVGLGACTDGVSYYIAFNGGVGPGTSNVLKISAGGTILQSLSLTWAAGSMATSRGHDICYDPTSNRLGVVSINDTTGVVATKIITLAAGTMADAGIELALTGVAGVTNLAATARCGVTHNGRMSVEFNRAPTRWDTGAVSTLSNGTLYIGGRLFTLATETAIATLTGAVNQFDFGQSWDPLFAGQVVAGHTLVGVMHGYEFINRSNQWVVLDVTSLYASGNITERTVVACGPVTGAERLKPSSVFSDGTKVAFAIGEGLSFSESLGISTGAGNDSMPVIRRSGVRRITLEPQGVQAIHVHDTTLLSGQLLHVFDGSKIRPHHFPEETPYIFSDGISATLLSAGGSLNAGSYSYQATWEAVNARGQVTRSGASPILTIPGVAAGQKATLHVTKPQLWNNASPVEFVRVRLWATQVNPTNNSPKFLVAEATSSTPATGFDVTMVHSTEAIGEEEELYETVETLADMRAPGADRGIAVVNERAWVADQNRLYVSKLLRPNLMISWNTEGSNVLILPSTLGTIQSLSSYNQGLVVLCSRGAAVVTGLGVDDTGAGPGWILQIIDGVPGTGTSSPRSATTTPAGVAFQAQDGNLWLATSNGQAVPMSRAVRDNALLSGVSDVINVMSTPSTNAMLIAQGSGGTLRVLDLEIGQWGLWTFPFVTPPNGLFLASISGTLWLQTSAPFVIGSVDAVAGGDTGGQVTAIVETGVLKPANPVLHGWGRLRSVILNEIRRNGPIIDPGADVTVQVYADQNDRVLLNKTLSTAPTSPVTFPGGADGALEFRTSSQRCAYFRVLVSITPAIFDVEGLDVWVANTGEKSPSNNRS